MLWPRRHSADRDRRQFAARLSEPRFLCRRHAEDRSRGGCPRDRRSCRDARPVCRGCCCWHSSRSSTRTWPARALRPAIAEMAVPATRAAMRWSAPAAAGRCTPGALRASSGASPGWSKPAFAGGRFGLGAAGGAGPCRSGDDDRLSPRPRPDRRVRSRSANSKTRRARSSPPPVRRCRAARRPAGRWPLRRSGFDLVAVAARPLH